MYAKNATFIYIISPTPSFSASFQKSVSFSVNLDHWMLIQQNIFSTGHSQFVKIWLKVVIKDS